MKEIRLTAAETRILYQWNAAGAKLYHALTCRADDLADDEMCIVRVIAHGGECVYETMPAETPHD